MNERILGEIDAYAFMVQQGKPAAAIPIKTDYLAAAVKYISKTHGSSTYYEELSEGWVTLWIYEYPHILEIIKIVRHSPQSTFDHWVLGKLFGYDEAAIAKFIGI